MILWLFLILGWVAILVVAVSLCRIAAYADNKVRSRLNASRLRRRDDQQAA